MFELINNIFLRLTKPKKKTAPVLTTLLYNSYESESDVSLRKLIQNGNGVVDQKKLEASQSFHEFLWRLDRRFQYLKQIEYAIYHAEPSNMTIPMKDIQLEFVNCVESYYQQLYATLSAFVMFLNYNAPREFKNGLPISRITNFLTFLGSKNGLTISEEIKELTRATIFRSKFVDHVQQHTLHNWMTYSFPTKSGPECVVIYYIGKGREVYYRPHLNPYADDFEPPVNYISFYVSPPHNECHRAIFDMCLKVIEHISNQQNTNL